MKIRRTFIPRRKTPLFLGVLFSLSLSAISAQQGPLSYQQLGIRYFPFYTFTAVEPGFLKGSDWQLNLSFALIQEFHFTDHVLVAASGTGVTDFDKQLLFDYEAEEFFQEFWYPLTPRLNLGYDISFTLFNGGFLDSWIEGFHRGLNLPNAGREHIPDNRVKVALYPKNADPILWDTAQVGIGDLNLKTHYLFYDKNRQEMAVQGILSLPLSNLTPIWGTSYGAIGAAWIYSVDVTKWFSFYTLQGLSIPLDFIGRGFENTPLPIYHGIITLEFPIKKFSPIIQYELLTSPYTGETPRPGRQPSPRFYLYPSNVLRLGFRWRIADEHLLQFSILEDLWPHAASDIGFSFGYEFKKKTDPDKGKRKIAKKEKLGNRTESENTP